MKSYVYLGIAISLIFSFSSEAGAALTSENYTIEDGVIAMAGPGCSSSSYLLQNIVGAYTGTYTGSIYKVISGFFSLNGLPTASISSYNDSSAVDDETPTLVWTYSDPDNDSQKRYQLQVGHDDFTDPVVDTGIISAAITSYTTPILPRTDEKTAYKWRVRVDDGLSWSGWVSADNGFYLVKGEFVITGLKALTALGQDEIIAASWQKDNDPYFYWQAPGDSLDISGYSYAIDALPDEQVDAEDTYYAVAQDYISDGAHTFYVKAKRSSGVWSEPASFEIWVDTAAPSVSSLTPSAGAVFADDIVQIMASASDSASGIDAATIEMRINQAQVSPVYNPENGQISYLPSIPFSDGEVTVSLTVADLLNNSTSSLTWSFTVDTAGPSGSVLVNNADQLTNTNIVSLNISAEDDDSVVSQMMLSNDGVFDTESWEAYTSLRRNWVLPAISGTRRVYARFRDEAGNISDTAFDDIDLMIVAPDTFILSGPSGMVESSQAQFTFRGSLTDCQFSYKFDEEEWSTWASDIAVTKTGLSEGNHYFMVKAAKDLDQDGHLFLNEVDSSPALRVWTVSSTGLLKPPAQPEKPIKRWEEE